MGFSITHLIILLVIVLIIFGGQRLPEIGSALGKSIRNFKKSLSDMDDIDVTPKVESKKEENISSKS